jgi:hypothetical protein
MKYINHVWITISRIHFSKSLEILKNKFNNYNPHNKLILTEIKISALHSKLFMIKY